MQSLFLAKFDFDYSANIKWIKIFEENVDILPPHALKLMSHIINVHHIWINRLQNKFPESDNWDVFDVEYLRQLHFENLRETNDFIEKATDLNETTHLELNGNMNEYTVSDVLYHILNHSNYHRAQISLLCKMNEIEVTATNFISWARKV